MYAGMFCQLLSHISFKVNLIELSGYSDQLLKGEKKAGYMAIPVACRLAGAVFEVTRPFVYEQCGQRIKT